MEGERNNMSELEKANKSRKRWISVISWIVSLLLAYLITWIFLKVTIGDVWFMLKSLFTNNEKIFDCVPRIEAIGAKLSASLIGGMITWFSKKLDEEIMQDFLKGNSAGVAQGIRTYSGMFIAIWFLMLTVFWAIFYFLIRWIISKFVWKENKEEEI